MAATDPVWVFVDARYQKEVGGFLAECPALGVVSRAQTREEAHEELSRAVARHLRPKLISGELADYLARQGFYLSDGGEWIPRITGEDERLYIRVTPIEPLPMVRVSAPFGNEDPPPEDGGEE
jgi:predicted RNase H-like HicB family nuclease